jgi:hypothetical protein
MSKVQENLSIIRTWHAEGTEDSAGERLFQSVLGNLLVQFEYENRGFVAGAAWVDTLSSIEGSNAEAYFRLGDEDKAHAAQYASEQLAALARKLHLL